jgi:polar amino acid transport system permease protein
MEELAFLYHTILPPLLKGTGVTLQLIALSAPMGMLIGILSAIGRVYGQPGLRHLCTLHQIVFRGIPLLVQLFILFYVLASWGVRLSPFTCAVTAFSICSGAYHAEYIRGAIRSIPDNQILAARSLALGRWQAIIFIVLPQALRRAIPPCSNEITYLIKYSSLAYMVTVAELMTEAKVLASRYFKPIEIFIIAGIIYWVLVTVATRLIERLEKKMEIPGIKLTAG